MQSSSTSILKQYWGYDTFRPLQEDVIQSVLQGRDTLALMPTGGGKSVCFQVPALQLDGICIVISPLIALMKDQIQQLKAKGIEAIAIFSGMSSREIDIALDNCIFGKIKFLYLAPERLFSDLVQERIRHMNVNLYAIDEAHCISQWGYDFRPSYLNLTVLRELHPKVPFLALTATATPRVVQDIQEKLLFHEHNVLQKSFERTNLAFMVLFEENKMNRMLRIIHKTGGSGVIYARNRRETQEVARFLVNNGISADYYHAGLSMLDRSTKQEAWTKGRIKTMVATNAFGMGIDKSDVRYVIHLDVPDSLEAYYQEAGRAGRDGKKAFPVLLYQTEDLKRLQGNFEANFPSVQFIQQVYHNLANYFQVPYGAGIGLTFDFDVVDFSKKYHQDIISTMSALKFLERDGWLSLSEAVFIPSRFKFEVDFKALYQFQVQSAKYDGLIKAILRSYGGVFEFFANINEYEFAKKLGLPYEIIVTMLDYLDKQGIATYIKSTDKPQLQFLQSRVDYKNLFIDTNFIRERKEIKQEQLNAVYAYVQATDCRSRALLDYFGEKQAKYCGQCDLCLIRIHQKNVATRLVHEIQHCLKEERKLLSEIIDAIDLGTDADKLKQIRGLIDQGKIRVEGEYYYWVHS